jgi:hypothetical protein
MGNNISTDAKLNFFIISDKNIANHHLNNAEKQDLYIETCHNDKANSIARRNLSYTSNTISLRDINYGNSFLEGIKDELPKRLLSDLGEIKIIHLMPTADDGMPHTRPGNIICFPNFSQIFSKSTLIHELWHIHQRVNNDLWLQTFKVLGWELWNDYLPEKIEDARRYNPDTIDAPLWIFQDTWIPIPVFKNITLPKVSDVEIWFYNKNKQYHTKQIPIELSSFFSELLPSIAYEHPREITAYMLSEPKKYSESIAFKKLIESIGVISITTIKNTII